MPHLKTAVGICLLLLTLCGCGGSGGGGSASQGSPQLANPVVPIEWGQRSRAITGPSSARSAVVKFDNASATGTDVSFEVDRAANPADYTASYTCPTVVKAGTALMHVWFQSMPGGTGTLVAQADVSVQILANGTLQRAGGADIGTIKASGLVNSVVVQASQTVTVGQASDLTVTAFDKNGGVVSLTPGSVFYQVTPGTGSANLDSTGHIVGVNPGTITVIAVVDGISSTSQSVTVALPGVAYTRISQPSNGMVLDTQTGHLWASVPSLDPVYGNSVIEIDPATTKVLASVFVGSEPTAIAISDDGTALYVSLKGAAKIARVDPVGKTLVSTFDVTAAGSFVNNPYAYWLAVQPGNPNVVAAIEQDYNDSGYLGPCIFSSGALLPNYMGIYDGLVVAFTSPTRIWSSNYGTGLYEGLVDSNGVTMVGQNGGIGGSMKAFGGNLFSTNGEVVSGSDGTLMGTFAITPQSYSDVTADLSAGRAFFTTVPYGQYQPSLLQVFDTTTYKLVASSQLPMPTGTASSFTWLTRWGAKGLAFQDGSYIYFVPQAPGL